MLSTGAFNALLKTLEEPPAHAIFILATTEPHRLPVTVLSRCQRYDFKRISESSIAGRLDLIASNEQIKIEPAAIRTIALLADGALRDAISLLDQAKISFPHGASEADIRQMSGQVDRQFMIRLIQGIIQSDVIQILQMLDQMIRDGQDIVRFTHSLASFYRDLLIIHAAGDTTALQSSSLGGLIHASDAEINQMKGLAAHYQQPEVVSRITQLSNLISDLRWSPNPRTLLEVGIMRLIGTRAAEIVAKQSAPVQQVAPIQQAPVQQVAPVQQATPVQQVAPVQQPTVKKEVQAAPQAVTPPQASPVHDDYPYPDEPYMDYDDYPHKEVVQSNQPTNAAVPEVAAPAKQVAPEREAETVPETVQAQASPVESQHAVTSAREAADVWAKILNAMQKQDMFCYLFAKEAKIEAGDGGLVVVFAEEEKAHYNVFSGDRGIKTLREAMRSALGHMLPYRVSLEGSEDGQAFSENQNDTRSWQDPIARAADSLGIPIERKD